MNILLKAALCVWALAFSEVASANGLPQTIFDTSHFYDRNLPIAPQWRRVFIEVEHELPIYVRCAFSRNACPSEGLYAWQQMITSQAGRPKIEQLKEVHRFVARWRYRSDRKNYRKDDYWATPTKFFSRSGDCEDYAIAVYVSMRWLGFRVEDLRIVVTKDFQRNLDHAIVAVRVGQEIYALDNLTDHLRLMSNIENMDTYYVLNELSQWTHLRPPMKLSSIDLEEIAVGRLVIPTHTSYIESRSTID